MQNEIADLALPFQLGAYNLQLTGVHECNKRFEGAWHEFPRRSKFARELGLLQGVGHLRQEFFAEFGRRLPHAYEWRQIGRASFTERVGQYGSMPVVAGALNTKTQS